MINVCHIPGHHRLPGHSRLQTTQIYAQVANNQIKNIKSPLDNLEKGYKTMNIKDGETELLKKRIIDIIPKFKEIIQTKEMVVRFHTDADGVSSALILKKILPSNTMFLAQRFATYGEKQLEHDLALMYPRENHVLILTDVGSGKGTSKSIQTLKSFKIKTVNIDHHPSDEGETANFDIRINPWDILKSHNPSRYTAGYLCGLVAKAIIEKGKIKRLTENKKLVNEINLLMGISLFGDNSTLKTKTNKLAEKLSIIIDINTAKKKYNLGFYEKLIENKELINEEWIKVEELIDSVISASKNNVKKYDLGYSNLFVVDLDPIYKETKFTARGKMLDMLFANYKKQDKTKKQNIIGVGYTNTGIMFRIDEKVPKELLADVLLKRLKETQGEFILSGGGHPHASSLQTKHGFVKSVVDQIVKYIKEYKN